MQSLHKCDYYKVFSSGEFESQVPSQPETMAEPLILIVYPSCHGLHPSSQFLSPPITWDADLWGIAQRWSIHPHFFLCIASLSLAFWRGHWKGREKLILFQVSKVQIQEQHKQCWLSMVKACSKAYSFNLSTEIIWLLTFRYRANNCVAQRP